MYKVPNATTTNAATTGLAELYSAAQARRAGRTITALQKTNLAELGSRGPKEPTVTSAPSSSGPDACGLFLPSFSETGMLVDTSPLHEALRVRSSSRPACVVGDKSTALMTSGRGLLRNVLFHGLRSALLCLPENSAAGRNLS